MKTVHLQYFAILRDERGLEKETISIEAQTYRSLFNELKAKHQFSITDCMVRVAVNDEFTKLDNPVVENARVVFIPPVAGG